MRNEFVSKYGEWALITGATSGIGKALAFELAQNGLNIALAARSKENLENTAKEIESRFKVQVKYVQVNLAEDAGIENLIKETDNLNIGLLILSAGIDNTGSFAGGDITKDLDVIKLNIVSVMMLTHHFSAKMVAQKRGGIMLVSSMTALMATPYYANYAGTKSYVLNFGHSLYGELKSKGVDVSVLVPGVTATPMMENTGIDWSKTKVEIMTAEDVASEAIKHFGKKLTIIPGRKNRLFAFIMKHLLTSEKIAVANEKMMRSAARNTPRF